MVWVSTLSFAMMIAAGYVRCSTDMQDESIFQQKKAIESWAMLNGFTILEWFEDEGKSGTSFEKRAGFMRMKDRVERGSNFKTILVYDESRWGRAGNPRESTYWRFHFERFGVKVKIINSQSRNENDIGSFVTEVVESAEASEYSRKLSRSTKRGCINRATSGYSSGGTAPFGYQRIAVESNSGRFVRGLTEGLGLHRGEEFVTLAPGTPSEVGTVKRIFTLHSQGQGYKSIAHTLNAENVPCPQRGRWKNKDQKWSAGTIRSILMNPVYYGARVYNRFPKNKLSGGKRGKRNPQSEWIVKEGAHEAIISKELWDRANKSTYQLTPGVKNIIHSQYLLSGLIKCSHCGFNYTGTTNKRKGIAYYVDGGYNNKGKSVCSSSSIPAQRLENHVVGLIEKYVVNSDVQREVEAILSAEERPKDEEREIRCWLSFKPSATESHRVAQFENRRIG